MIGLNKIIDRILFDAKEEARLTLEAAQKDCKKAEEDYAARAEELSEEITARASAAAEELVETARKQAAENREQTLERTRRALIDEAFELAKKDLRKTDFGKYRELLTALLTSSLIEVTERREKEIATGAKTEEIAHYKILMNEADRAAYGEGVVRAARCAAYRRIGAARVDRVQLSEETVSIDGGLHLYCDEELIDLSLEALLRELRETIEPRVAALLFPEDLTEENA